MSQDNSDWTAHEPCPECGGTSFREQEIQYVNVEGSEGGGLEHLSVGDYQETIAIFCNNDDCPHSEEPLLQNYEVVPVGDNHGQ